MLTPHRRLPMNAANAGSKRRSCCCWRKVPLTLAPPSAEGEPACSWGTGPETGTTLSLRLAGGPEPKALRSAHDDPRLWVGAVFLAASGHPVDASDAQEHGDPACLACSRGAPW